MQRFIDRFPRCLQSCCNKKHLNHRSRISMYKARKGSINHCAQAPPVDEHSLTKINLAPMQETETESRDGSRGAAQETPAREITWSDWLATQEGSWGWGRSGSGIYMPQWVGGGGCDGGERGRRKGWCRCAAQQWWRAASAWGTEVGKRTRNLSMLCACACAADGGSTPPPPPRLHPLVGIEALLIFSWLKSREES